jgi:carboxylesterase type B
MAGYDGVYIKQGLYTASCNHEDATGSDVPLLIGSNLNEWSFFDNRPENYDKSKILDYNLKNRLMKKDNKEYKDVDTWCPKEKLLELYKDFKYPAMTQATCDWYLEEANPDNRCNEYTQLATDVMFTIGPQILSAAKGAKKYRYLLETTGTGTQPGQLDSSHGDELCFYHTTTDKHWKNSNQMSGGGSCNGMDEDNEAGQVLREYWTTFAKTGVPSSSKATVAGVEEWTPVEQNSVLGTPLMYLNLASRSNLSWSSGKRPQMINDAWSTNAAAELLRSLHCEQVTSKDLGC